MLHTKCNSVHYNPVSSTVESKLKNAKDSQVIRERSENGMTANTQYTEDKFVMNQDSFLLQTAINPIHRN